MKNLLINIAVFAVGAGVGVLATRQYFKKKYEQIAQDEINSVKEVYAKKKENNKSVEEVYYDPFEDTDNESTQEDVEDYATRLEGYDYIQNAMDKIDKPYVIKPEEYGELEEEGYECISLTYYIDGVLADENDEPVEDVDNTIGKTSLNHFGEYEDDSVFVRNDRRKCDFEILLDQRNYSDIIKTKPHLSEV